MCVKVNLNLTSKDTNQFLFNGTQQYPHYCICCIYHVLHWFEYQFWRWVRWVIPTKMYEMLVRVLVCYSEINQKYSLVIWLLAIFKLLANVDSNVNIFLYKTWLNQTTVRPYFTRRFFCLQKKNYSFPRQIYMFSANLNNALFNWV